MQQPARCIMQGRSQEAETSIPSVHGVLVLSWGKRHSRQQIAVSHFLARRESLICCNSTIWVSSVHPTSSVYNRGGRSTLLHRQTRHLGGFFLFLGLTIMNLMEIDGVGHHISTSSGAIAESLMKNISQSLIFEHQGSHIPEDQAFTLTSKPVTFTRVPRWPWFVFLGGAMVCLSFSSITHLLHSHSRRANFFFWALDYTGISTMIISSFFPAIYYAFFCHPTLQLLYLSTISLIGLITVITLSSPSLSSPRFRPLRGGLFLGMGFWGLIPTVHAIIINWGHSYLLMGHAYEAAMALAYATGAGIYMSRIPERWRPGAFDIVGHSHQIFHVFVILGALAHYTAMRVLMDWRDGGATCLLQ